MFQKDLLFWFCALAGSGMFLIQFLLVFLGSQGDDFDESTAKNFKWLSKQALTGFLMMFGWVGLACKKEFFFSSPLSLLLATLSGFGAMLISGSLFKTARKLHSSGTIFSLEEAIGKEAFVYQRIPKNGAGKITISLQNLTHEIDAISLNGEELPSFSQVQIVKKADDKTLIVIPIK